MRTQTKLEQFVKYDPEAGKVLTVIVNTDQSTAANMNRGFATFARAKLREAASGIQHSAEAEQFQQCAELALRFIQSYRPHAKSIALFCQANGSMTTRELNVSLETEVRWQDLPHIQPLLEAEVEYDELLLVMTDRSHSRFVTSILGELSELPEVVNPFPPSHTQAPGNDKTKSQADFHHKADEHERHYLKVVGATVESIARKRSIQHIVLAGISGPSRELYFQLPKEAQKRVISFAVLPMHASHADIATVIAGARENAEHRNESTKVGSLIERAAAGSRALTGARETMEALAEGRVHELIYAHDIALKGGRCRTCNNIVVNHTACSKCLTEFQPVDDAIDLILGAALDSGAAVQLVRHDAAEKLMAAGGIGAFLRY